MHVLKTLFPLRPLLLVAALLLLVVPGQSLAASTMPHFSLPSAEDGSTIDSNSYKGQAMIINFFATWCPPCRKEIPSLISLQNEYGPRGLTVIGMSTDQGGSKLVEKFMKKMQINYPVVMADGQTPRDFGGILGIPTSFLVNRQGLVVKRYDGYVDHQTLVRDLESILN